MVLVSRFRLLAGLIAVSAAGCTGGAADQHGATTSPVPVVSSLSPSGVSAGGPSLTLTVSGTGFVPGSTVAWNGASRETTFIDSTHVSAVVLAADTAAPGAATVTVVTTPPGGGTSNALPFCTTAAEAGASKQTRVRLGAFYFDGWSGDLTNPHFNGLAAGAYTTREPLMGWRDNTACSVEQQLAWARRFGLGFFVFDWYFDAATRDPWKENMNSALELTRALRDRHGMKYAILYVNTDPFVVGPADWSTAVAQWVALMKDPDYVAVNGRPLFVVFDIARMRKTFGSSSAVSDAFTELRLAAKASGLPGVTIAGVIYLTDGAVTADGLFPDLSGAKADGYDAMTTYTYAFSIPLGLSGQLPYSSLADVGRWTMAQAAAKSPVAFIPGVSDGWDARPWAENEPGRPEFWFARTPQGVAGLLDDAMTWAESNRRVGAEPSPAPPLVILGSWNELGEGSYIVPTVGDGTAYGDAIATTLSAPTTRARSIITLTDSGPSDPHRSATGALTDEAGAPIAGASVTLSAAPTAGAYATVQFSGTAPADAAYGYVGFRVNTDDPIATWPGYWSAGPGPSDFSVYGLSYLETATNTERIPNGDFSGGINQWSLDGNAQIVASDRGQGQMVQVQAAANQRVSLSSVPFSVTGGAAYRLSISARVAPASSGSGYFLLAFEPAGGNVNGTFLQLPGASVGALHSQTFPLAPAKIALGVATTDSAGRFRADLTALSTSPAGLEASYAGDTRHWPGFARVGP